MRANAAKAVVFESPGDLSLREVGLPNCGPRDCLVEVDWTGISTGTERLLWNGQMPPFPGLAYPLVPGYESVGRVVAAGSDCAIPPGTPVFVPGSRGFTDVTGLFGGAAKRLVVPADRLIGLDTEPTEQHVLLALTATAVHAVEHVADIGLPDLIIGHGVLGRLIARICVAQGRHDLTVWETEPRRRGKFPYRVVAPEEDTNRQYNLICDVSGDAGIVNLVMPHLAHSGTVLLAGFYQAQVAFDFPPAFMKEASIRIAAEWQSRDIQKACTMVRDGSLSLNDLITHRFDAASAVDAYDTAFSEPECLKSILDWRDL